MAGGRADLSLDALRSVVQDSLGKHLYENAIFFADKLVSLSKSPDDVYRLVQGYLFTKQYRRALHVLQTTGLKTAESRFRYISARCYMECHEWDECLNTLSDASLAEVQVGALLAHLWGAAACQGPVCTTAYADRDIEWAKRHWTGIHVRSDAAAQRLCI